MILYGLLMVLHVLASVALVIAVLLQAGRGGGLASTFGGGGAQQMFGGRGAGDFLTKSTQILGGTFMATSLFLFLLSGTISGRGTSADDEIIDRFRQTTPLPAPQGGGLPGSAPGSLPPISTAPLGTPPSGDAGSSPAPSAGSTVPPAPAAPPPAESPQGQSSGSGP